MTQIATEDRRVIFQPLVYHMNTKQAEAHAVRVIGKDWLKRGYRISNTEVA